MPARTATLPRASVGSVARPALLQAFRARGFHIGGVLSATVPRASAPEPRPKRRSSALLLSSVLAAVKSVPWRRLAPVPVIVAIAYILASRRAASAQASPFSLTFASLSCGFIDTLAGAEPRMVLVLRDGLEVDVASGCLDLDLEPCQPSALAALAQIAPLVCFALMLVGVAWLFLRRRTRPEESAATAAQAEPRGAVTAAEALRELQRLRHARGHTGGLCALCFERVARPSDGTLFCGHNFHRACLEERGLGGAADPCPACGGAEEGENPSPPRPRPPARPPSHSEPGRAGGQARHGEVGDAAEAAFLAADSPALYEPHLDLLVPPSAPVQELAGPAPPESPLLEDRGPCSGICGDVAGLALTVTSYALVAWAVRAFAGCPAGDIALAVAPALGFASVAALLLARPRQASRASRVARGLLLTLVLATSPHAPAKAGRLSSALFAALRVFVLSALLHVAAGGLRTRPRPPPPPPRAGRDAGAPSPSPSSGPESRKKPE
eukprot:tig00021374_g21125.t1